MRILSAPLVACLAAATLLAAGAASARPDEARDAADHSAPETEPSVVEQYCTNIRDAAADARHAWQMEALRELEKQVGQRIAELDARIAELQRARQSLSKLARECAAGDKGPCPIIASFEGSAS